MIMLIVSIKLEKNYIYYLYMFLYMKCFLMLKVYIFLYDVHPLIYVSCHLFTPGYCTYKYFIIQNMIMILVGIVGFAYSINHEKRKMCIMNVKMTLEYIIIHKNEDVM